MLKLGVYRPCCLVLLLMMYWAFRYVQWKENRGGERTVMFSPILFLMCTRENIVSKRPLVIDFN